MKRVIVHIDRLVLNGYPQDERHAFATSLQVELGKLLADPALAERIASLGNVAHIRVGQPGRAHSVGPEQPGTSVAKAIVGGLSR